MASIRQLYPKGHPKHTKDTPWIVEYTDASGKRRRKTPPSGLQKDAKALRTQIESELADGTHVADRASKTVAEVCALFLQQAEAKLKDGRIGRSRYEALKGAIDLSIVPVIGRLKIKELQVDDVETLYHKMQEQRAISPLTARGRVYILKQVEDFAIRRKWLRAGVASIAASDLRGISRPVVKPFKIEQIASLFRALEHRKWRGHERSHFMVKIIVNLAAFLGMRKGEIFALRLENIDLESRVIHIRHNLTAWDLLKPPKTAKGVRDDIIPTHIADMLKIWISDYYILNDRQLLFRSHLDAGFISTSHWHNIFWRPLLVRAGLHQLDGDQFHFHALRKFQASWKNEHGLSVSEIIDALGHTTFDTTLQSYIGPLTRIADKRESRDAISDALLRRTEHIVIDATETRLIPLSPSDN